MFTKPASFRVSRVRLPSIRPVSTRGPSFLDVRMTVMRDAMNDMNVELQSLRARMEAAEQRLGRIELTSTRTKGPEAPRVQKNGAGNELFLWMVCINILIINIYLNVLHDKSENTEERLKQLEDTAGVDARLRRVEQDIQQIRIQSTASDK